MDAMRLAVLRAIGEICVGWAKKRERRAHQIQGNVPDNGGHVACAPLPTLPDFMTILLSSSQHQPSQQVF